MMTVTMLVLLLIMRTPMMIKIADLKTGMFSGSSYHLTWMYTVHFLQNRNDSFLCSAIILIESRLRNNHLEHFSNAALMRYPDFLDTHITGSKFNTDIVFTSIFYHLCFFIWKMSWGQSLLTDIKNWIKEIRQ